MGGSGSICKRDHLCSFTLFYVMQRDTTGLTAENKELKLRLQAMEQQAHLRDGINFLITYHFKWSL